ncbi:MAG: cytidylate kinase-like family protein [Deltaproteobacteria bacterium]|nr:cytidylate kinase-like family protein [Deltaproteobacteria bacterium]
MALITISRKMGSGAEQIARMVADGLKLELYDDEKLQEEAVKQGLSTVELKGFDEKAPGFFDRLLNHKPEAYLDLMESVVYKVAEKGEGVIIGHGGQMLLRDFGCALHVMVLASEETRVQNVMDQQGLSREAADKLVRKSDHEQRAFLRFAFHMDREDEALYDIVVNTEKLSAESATKLVLEAANLQEINTCSLTALDAMKRLSQLKKVEAELLKNNVNLATLYMDVPEKGIVEIRGLAYTLADRDRIIDVAKGVSGISDVKPEIVVKAAAY